MMEVCLILSLFAFFAMSAGMVSLLGVLREGER